MDAEKPRKRPKKDKGASLLRWSEDEFALITQAAEKNDQPLPVFLRRTVLREAAKLMGLSKARLRGTKESSVKSQPARVVPPSSRAGGDGASKNRGAGAATGRTSVSTTDAAPDAERETVSRRTGT